VYAVQYEVVEEAAWLKREEVIQNNLPAFVELLNEQEVLKLAGLKVSAHHSLVLFNLHCNLN
jgi:hypothetical protein